MLYGMANNNVIIPAERDGALYNFLLGNQDYVFDGIGDEFAITSSSSSFVLTLGTGEGVVCGRHVTEDGTNPSILQLTPNTSGYVAIRIDLTQVPGAEAYLFATPTLQQDNLNSNGSIHDLPLYRYVTNGSGVSSFIDVRNISKGSNVVCELSGGQLYAYYYENGVVTRKQVGSLDPDTLTATPADVKSGKTFGGAGSDEPQTGTFAGQSKTTGPYAHTVYPDAGKYLTSVTVSAPKTQTVSQTISIAQAEGSMTATFTFSNLSTVFGITKIQKLSGSELITMFSGYPDPGTGDDALNIPSGGISGNRITQRFINNSNATNQSAVIAITAVGV